MNCPTILYLETKRMKKIVYLLLLVACFVTAQAQDVLPPPNPPRLVVDNANILTGAQQQELENKLVALDDSSSNQIAIVIIPTLNDYPVEDYAVKLFRSWGIGDKKKNNGILLLVSMKEHAMRIEVGYGLEGAIPDITAKSIIDNDLAPAFRSGDYYSGFDKAINSLSQAAVGEYKVARDKKKDGSSGAGETILFFIIVFIIIVVIRGGGGGGGRGRGGSILPFLFLGGGGGNWGGGGRSSGGFGGGGGGFGGFGGGSSGGGGASGSW